MRIPLLHLMSGKYQQFGGVPWKQIKGMRDKIAHGYEVIDLDRVWDTALLDIQKHIVRIYLRATKSLEKIMMNYIL